MRPTYPFEDTVTHIRTLNHGPLRLPKSMTIENVEPWLGGEPSASYCDYVPYVCISCVHGHFDHLLLVFSEG